MIILLDQDGPLADFEAGFLNGWREKFPEHPHVPLANRKAFYVREDYPNFLRKDIESIYFAKGFYENLPVVDGAIEALNTMLDLGHDVYICTSPLSGNKYCASEKHAWIREKLGKDFFDRTIITKDKTLVRGDFLIDDKSAVGGILRPEWKHFVFDAPYNQEAENPHINWGNWRETLGL